MVFILILVAVVITAIASVVWSLRENAYWIKSNWREPDHRIQNKAFAIWEVLWRLVVWTLPAIGIGAFVITIFGLTYGGIMGGTGTVGHTTEKTKLVAVSAGPQSTDGAFFLGSGAFDSHRTLNFMTQRDADGERFKLSQVPTDDSDILQDATPETAFMYHFSWYREDTSGFWFPGPQRFDGDSFLSGIGTDSWEFHVPKGSVRTGDWAIANK